MNHSATNEAAAGGISPAPPGKLGSSFAGKKFTFLSSGSSAGNGVASTSISQSNVSSSQPGQPISSLPSSTTPESQVLSKVEPRRPLSGGSSSLTLSNSNKSTSGLAGSRFPETSGSLHTGGTKANQQVGIVANTGSSVQLGSSNSSSLLAKLPASSLHLDAHPTSGPKFAESSALTLAAPGSNRYSQQRTSISSTLFARNGPSNQQIAIAPVQNPEDPFHEITRTIQTQSKRIRELETMVKERDAQLEQTNLKLFKEEKDAVELQETVTALTSKLMRLEKSVEQKDADLQLANSKMDNLEGHRTQLLKDNGVLAKVLEDEKRRFARDLKKSTDIVLVLQSIGRKRIYQDDSSDCEPEIPVAVPAVQLDTMPTVPAKDHEELLLKSRDLEKKIEELRVQMQEAAIASDEEKRNSESLRGWLEFMQPIINNCDSCSRKFYADEQGQSSMDESQISSNGPIVQDGDEVQ